MKNVALLVVGLALLCVELREALGDQRPPESIDVDVQVRIRMRYLLSLPKDYEKQPSWPLLIFLHGSGERGNDLEKVKAHGPPKLIADGKEFPFIVASPQCPKGETWEPLSLVAVLDDLESKYKVDRDRIYITGLSMGGYGTWHFAAYAHDRIAAIAPICGGGETEWVERISKVPVWIFHGASDKEVPLTMAISMFEALKKKGGRPKFTIYPDSGHNSWTETYDNPALFEWLLAQKRSNESSIGK